MAKPDLRIVRGEAVHDPRQPEDVLPNLFATEAALTRQLADVRRSILEERRRYGAKHGLLMLPSYDTLRRLFT